MRGRPGVQDGLFHCMVHFVQKAIGKTEVWVSGYV